MNPETHSCDCGYTWRHGHSGTHLCGPQYRATIERQAQDIAALKSAQPVSENTRPEALMDTTVMLSGHQLRMALDLINPGGLDERDELDDQLLFGIRQHRDDDGKISTDMCCWNGDTDGVLPLDGEYEAHGGANDAERLDWLNKNFFSDQKDEWDERQAPNSIKWKFFGPMGVQGNVRDVIDAARAKDQPQ